MFFGIFVLNRVSNLLLFVLIRVSIYQFLSWMGYLFLDDKQQNSLQALEINIDFRWLWHWYQAQKATQFETATFNPCLRHVYTTEKNGPGPVKKVIRTHNFYNKILEFLQGHRRLCRYPVGILNSLINLKKAEHWNNEPFVYCFRYCLVYSHLSTVNSPLIPEKNRVKTRTG